jgi:hypothetical protein
VSLVILEHPGELSDDDLDRELTIAASTRGRLRFDRYEQLLDEARDRGRIVWPDTDEDD